MEPEQRRKLFEVEINDVARQFSMNNPTDWNILRQNVIKLWVRYCGEITAPVKVSFDCPQGPVTMVLFPEAKSGPQE